MTFKLTSNEKTTISLVLIFSVIMGLFIRKMWLSENSTMIEPQIGRNIHYYVDHEKEPQAAIIVKVWDEHLVNIAVFDPNGAQYGLSSIKLVQPGEDRPQTGGFCLFPDQGN